MGSCLPSLRGRGERTSVVSESKGLAAPASAYEGVEGSMPGNGLPATAVMQGSTSLLPRAARSTVPRWCTFLLNMLCGANGVQLKSSNGLEAVHTAQRREWQRLREYCADDVQILCDLYRRRRLVEPADARGAGAGGGGAARAVYGGGGAGVCAACAACAWANARARGPRGAAAAAGGDGARGARGGV